MRNKEHNLQAACVRWFRYEYPKFKMLLYAIPNGGKRNIKTAQYLKAEGVVAGVADLFLSIPSGGFCGLYIEMKTETGRQTEKQKEFEKEVKAAGYDYIIVRTFEGFQTAINNYLIF